jgi:hypothetical protein
MGGESSLSRIAAGRLGKDNPDPAAKGRGFRVMKDVH